MFTPGDLKRIAGIALMPFFSYLGGMEVHFTPETEKKLNDLAAQSGCGADEVLKDALAGYFEEVEQTRQMLDSRYDDIKSGSVKLIPGEEVFAELRAKSAAHRTKPQ
jgi:BioD-like phosphotransacetylase family protein